MFDPRISGQFQANPPVANNNNHVRQNQATGEFTPEVLKGLQQAIVSANRSRGHHVVAFIGNTGSGKSTIVNHLMGCKMVPKKIGGRYYIDVDAGNTPFTVIGHNRTESETRYAEAHSMENFGITLVDCGGFLDTRGCITEVVVSASMKMSLENAASVILVLCFDASLLEADRGNHLSTFMDTALNRLIGNQYQNYPESILLVITKPQKSEPGWGWHSTNNASQDARELLTEQRAEMPHDSRRKDLHDFVLREGGKYILVHKPLEANSRADLLGLLTSMSGIKDPGGKFNLAYSASTALSILSGFTRIALLGIDLFDQQAVQSGIIIRLEQEVTGLEPQIDKLRTNIATLGDGTATVEVIEQVKNSLIQENTQIIAQEAEIIEQLQGDTQEKEAEITAVNERIALWEKEGQQEIEYWKDEFRQPKIAPRKGSTTTTKTDKSGFLGFGRSSTTVTTITPDEEGRSLGHDFSYRGPEFHKVEKEAQTGEWSKEEASEDKTSYRIHYESGIGVDASANIRAHILKRNDPTALLKRSGYDQELSRLNIQITVQLEEIRRHEAKIVQAEKVVAIAKNEIEKLDGLKENLAGLESAKSELLAKIFQATNERQRIANQIQNESPLFDFLMGYLELSKDQQVRNHDLIKVFIEKRASYFDHMLED